MTTARLPPELRDVVDRAARLPRGLGLLQTAPVAAAAAQLGVAPEAVTRARICLDDPGQRDALVHEFRLARARLLEALGPQRAPAPPPCARTPAELVHAARTHPLGLDFLLHAPPESCAVLFAVPPATVLAARELLRAEGADADAGEDDGSED